MLIGSMSVAPGLGGPPPLSFRGFPQQHQQRSPQIISSAGLPPPLVPMTPQSMSRMAHSFTAVQPVVSKAGYPLAHSQSTGQVVRNLSPKRVRGDADGGEIPHEGHTTPHAAEGNSNQMSAMLQQPPVHGQMGGPSPIRARSPSQAGAGTGAPARGRAGPGGWRPALERQRSASFIPLESVVTASGDAAQRAPSRTGRRSQTKEVSEVPALEPKKNLFSSRHGSKSQPVLPPYMQGTVEVSYAGHEDSRKPTKQSVHSSHRRSYSGGTSTSTALPSDEGSELELPKVSFTPCTGHGAQFVPNNERKALFDVITSLLENEHLLKSVVARCFDEVVLGGGHGWSTGIEPKTVLHFRSTIASMLGVPTCVFPGIRRQHIRFDLDGTGKLDRDTAFIMVKMNLWEFRKKIAKYTSGVNILPKSLQDAGYGLLGQLGHGNQCSANLARDRSGRHWCLKTYSKAKMKPLDLECLKSEYELLQRLGRHENIASVSEVFQDSNHIYMVMDLYQGGDFTSLKRRALKNNGVPTESWWRGVFRQCFNGLLYIHEQAMMHGDIKESNLMLQQDKYDQPQVIIIDFGLSQTAVSDASVIWGTPGYIAPETWETGSTFPSGDIFAMGVVILQMLLDRIPPHHSPPPDAEILPGGIFTEGVKTMQEVGIVTRAREPPFNELPAEQHMLGMLTRRCLEKDVMRRPGARQVLQHEWFTSAIGPLNEGIGEMFFRWFG